MTETLNYSIIRKDNEFELRQYPAHIKAEVEVAETTYQKALYKGFNALASYIFGDNLTAKKIEMTSPVQVTNSQKIAMTKPVTISGADEEGIFVVAFIMPTEYTQESLPKPKNPAIRLTTIESQKMATHRFSGYFSEGKVRKAKQRLTKWLANENFEMQSDFIVARYDPPWVPWFLARNEVLVSINK